MMVLVCFDGEEKPNDNEEKEQDTGQGPTTKRPEDGDEK